MKKLYHYLLKTTQKNESVYDRYARFGEQVGASMYTVRKWAYGQRRVPDEMKPKIEQATHGKITIEDLVRAKSSPEV